MKKALVITTEMAHQDPRVGWNLTCLEKNYDITIVSLFSCLNKENIEFYKKYNVIETNLRNLNLFQIFIISILELIKLTPLILANISIFFEFITSIFKKNKAYLEPNALKIFIFFVLIYRKIPKEKYDLIWCHEFISVIPGLRYKLQNPLTKIAWDEHEIGICTTIQKLQNLISKHIDYFISLNSDILTYQLEKLPALKNKSYIIPNIPLKKNLTFKPIQERIKFVIIGMESKRLNLAMSSILEQWKDFANNSKLELHCYLMQNSSLALQKSSKYNNINYKNVFFHDPLSNYILNEKIKEYDIGVCPYFNDEIMKFACPNKIGEYIHAGLAIMTSEYTIWYNKEISKMNCGFSFILKDLKKIIEDILENPQIINQMKENSCKNATTQWNYEYFFNKLNICNL